MSGSLVDSCRPGGDIHNDWIRWLGAGTRLRYAGQQPLRICGPYSDNPTHHNYAKLVWRQCKGLIWHLKLVWIKQSVDAAIADTWTMTPRVPDGLIKQGFVDSEPGPKRREAPAMQRLSWASREATQAFVMWKRGEGFISLGSWVTRGFSLCLTCICLGSHFKCSLWTILFWKVIQFEKCQLPPLFNVRPAKTLYTRLQLSHLLLQLSYQHISVESDVVRRQSDSVTLFVVDAWSVAIRWVVDNQKNQESLNRMSFFL